MEGQTQTGTQRSPTPEISGVQSSNNPVLDASHQQHHNGHDSRSDEKDQGDVYMKELRGEKSNSQDLDPNAKYANESQDVEGGEPEPQNRFRVFRMRYHRQIRIVMHMILFGLFTGWWIAGLIVRRELGWIVPFLVWLAIALRVLFFYVPISIVTKPIYSVWSNTVPRVLRLIPEKFQTPLGAAVAVAVYLIGSFVSEESAENSRENRAISLFGLVVLIFGLWLTSRNRKKIVWRTVIVGMLLQYIIALFVLRTKAGFDIFKFVSDRARDLLGFANEGTAFLTDETVPTMTWFLVSVVPAIIFFVSLVQLLYYCGFLQWFIGKVAVFFFWALRVSGAEAVVAAASPFIGQGESAMLIKPFVNYLTMAEIHQIMCSGFATIAGSVLIAYISMGVNPQILISSCVMSIPASLAVSKMRYPETEETLTAGRVVVPDEDGDRPANALHAFAAGAWLGLKIGTMITATLLCIISLIGLLNGLLTWWGRYLTIDKQGDEGEELTIQLIVGYICYPIAFLLGVPRGPDLLKVGKLIGIKLIANEFVAYNDLQTNPEFATLSTRARLIATYALCGFANIGSLGNQIGVLAQLAPARTGDVSRVAISAMLTGALSTLSSASVAGLVMTNQEQFAAPPPAV